MQSLLLSQQRADLATIRETKIRQTMEIEWKNLCRILGDESKVDQIK